MEREKWGRQGPGRLWFGPPWKSRCRVLKPKRRFPGQAINFLRDVHVESSIKDSVCSRTQGKASPISTNGSIIRWIRTGPHSKLNILFHPKWSSKRAPKVRPNLAATLRNTPKLREGGLKCKKVTFCHRQKKLQKKKRSFKKTVHSGSSLPSVLAHCPKVNVF